MTNWWENGSNGGGTSSTWWGDGGGGAGGTCRDGCVPGETKCTFGCTDPTAPNYDPLAQCDDGSCDIITYGECVNGGGWNCVDLGDARYECQPHTGAGSGVYADENACENCTDCNCQVSSECLSCTGTSGEIAGCCDPTAFNYDPAATCNDGSCIAFIYGCTDPTACNYYAGANIDDGSCVYEGCTDPLASNYLACATVDDGSCVYSPASCLYPDDCNSHGITTVVDSVTGAPQPCAGWNPGNYQITLSGFVGGVDNAANISMSNPFDVSMLDCTFTGRYQVELLKTHDKNGNPTGNVDGDGDFSVHYTTAPGAVQSETFTPANLGGVSAGDYKVNVWLDINALTLATPPNQYNPSCQNPNAAGCWQVVLPCEVGTFNVPCV
jgi:hypothetical protein